MSYSGRALAIASPLPHGMLNLTASTSRPQSGDRPMARPSDRHFVQRPPNILWICADDYAPYVSGTYGDPLARTPNPDRLAAGGLPFGRRLLGPPPSPPPR